MYFHIQGVPALRYPKEIEITQQLERLRKKQRYHSKVEKKIVMVANYDIICEQWNQPVKVEYRKVNQNFPKGFFFMVTMIPSGNSDTSQLRLKIGS